MATPLTIQENLKRQLTLEKQAATLGDQTGATQPAWMNSLADKGFISPQVQLMMKSFSNLLLELPMMANTHNQPAIEVYFKKLVEEVTKIYAFPLLAIDIDPTLTPQKKTALTDKTLADLRMTLNDLAQRLGVNV